MHFSKLKIGIFAHLKHFKINDLKTICYLEVIRKALKYYRA